MQKKTFLSVLFLCLFLRGFSQKKQASLVKTIDSVLVIKPKTYKHITTFLKPYRRDTTHLKILIKHFKKAHYLDGLTYAENMLGTRYRNYTDYDNAIKLHKKALKTAEKANSIEFRVFSLNMLGVDYRRMDANRTALDYNQEALELAETVKNPSLGLRRSIAVSHNSMGNIYLILRQYDLAIKQFLQSQKIEKSIDNKLGLAINNQNIGYAKDAQGKIEEALQYYQTSLDINKKLNNKLGIMICNSSIADIYIKQGKTSQALTLLKNNLPIVKKMGNKYYLSFEYLNLGWAQTKQQKFKLAEKNINKGLDLAKKYHLTSAISAGYSHLSELFQKKKNYKKALYYYKLADEFDEKITNERNIQYVNDLILNYDNEKKNTQIKDLAKQNEITKLQLNKNRNLWITSIILLSLLSVILYSLYRHKLLHNEKQIMTLEQDALRSQMNPHFIFNALNSIKLYIINNEQKNAVRYLNKFSKLMRKILEVSAVKETSLAQELETMDLYMAIESIRFSNEIDFEIKVGENVSLEQVKVPPLVLQPFLENALWHGLSPKKGDKKMKLSVQKLDKNFIKISIKDNGVGREAAAKIKSKKIVRRKSIGIQLTKERLYNFVKEKGCKNSFSLDYKDLKDSEGNPTGTEIILLIPLN